MSQSPNKKVLYISPLPPPAGGIASWTEKVFKYGLPNDYVPCLVDTRIRGSRPIFGRAVPSMTELYRTTSIIGNLVLKLSTCRFEIAHLNSSLSPAGVIRELICAILIRLRGIPLITHYHGNLAAFPRGSMGGASFSALRLLLRLSAVNLILNQPSRQLCVQLAREKGIKRCVLMPNFIEDAIFQRRVEGSQAAHARMRAVFVGGLTQAKGAMDVVELAGRLPDIDFELIGHMLPDFASIVDTLPGNVSILGSLPYENVITHVASCDLFVFPSHMEGFPLAVLEAMSLGLPVVASSVGAIPEMIEEGKGGFLAEPCDIEGFVSGIKMLAGDAALRERLGSFNLQKSRENYSYAAVTEHLTSVYDWVRHDRA